MQSNSSAVLDPGEWSDEALRVTQTIFQHAARISSESEISNLLLLNADLARDLTGADRCTLWLADETHREIWTKVAHGVKEIRVALGSGLVGACIEKNESILVNDAEHDSRFLKSVDQQSGYVTKSVLTVPLRASGQVIGAIQVLNKAGGFGGHDIEMLSLMALYAASEIQSEKLRQEAETARLLRRELDLARDVQQNLLPRDFSGVPGLEFEAFFRPAKSVGGDYFDFLELPEGYFSFTTGDVSGKGLPAAVLMASIQTLLRSHLLRQAFPLERLIAEVSHTVYRCSSPDRYSTLFCGVLDQTRRTLTYVNAGHVPPLVIRAATREMERPGSSGLPIGILPNTQYQVNTIALDHGDTVVCISDGLSEVINQDGVMWEEREVEAVVSRMQGESVGALIGALVGRADEYAAGVDQYDDMTVAAVRVTM